MEPLRDNDPKTVGPYRLESRLGEGGMGQVFLGTSPAGDKVAVKLLKPELADSIPFRKRFAREVDAARQVGGPYTTHVVDADPQANPPWLATVYIPGPSLHETVIDDGPMGVDAVRALGIGLAEGLSQIHDRGLVHRDLKPSNVIMAADGPKIIDFGIAHTADASTLTATGTVIGTYAYMSPEQITADAADAASDIFALGCVLAYAATGTSPFDATTIPATIHRILSESPELAGISGDLRDAIETCMAKDPTKRPGIVGLIERLTVLSSVPLPATIVEPTSPYLRSEAPDKPAVATASPPTLLQSPDRGIRRAASASPLSRFSRRALFAGGLAALLIAAVPAVLLWPNHGGSHPEESESKALKEITVVDEQRIAANGSINDLTFSPDGTVLASTSGANGDTELWNVDTGVRVDVLPGTAACELVFSPDGAMLASGGCMGGHAGVQLWDVRTGEKITTLTDLDSERLEFSPDGKTLAVVDYGGHGDKILLWNVESGEKLASMDMKMSAPIFEFSPDGNTLAVDLMSGLENMHIELWDVRTAEKIKTFDSEEMYGEIFFSRDGETLMTVHSVDSGNAIDQWDIETGDSLATVPVYDSFTVDFSADRTTCATAGGLDDGEPESGTFLWSMDTGKVVHTLTTDATFDVVYSPAGNAIASTTDGTDFLNEIILWTLG